MVLARYRIERAALMDQKAFYEKQAGPFHQMAQHTDHALVGRDKFVIDYIAQTLPNNKCIFTLSELSIGEGRLTRALLQTFPNMKLHGTDISPNRIHYVQCMLEGIPDVEVANCTFTECNLDIEFAWLHGTSQDFVVALDILEHVLDVFYFIENCSRILKKDGYLFLRVPNVAYLKHRIRLLCGKLPVTASWFGPSEDLSAWRMQHGWDGGHLHLFTLPILERLLANYGFRIETCRDPGTRFQQLRNVLPRLFYANPLIVARKS